jgi:hypothetical protein
MEVGLFHVDGQTDGQTVRYDEAFHNLAKAPIKKVPVQKVLKVM